MLALAVIASGAGAMALEILWFRALLQFVPATTYAFTTMLVVVLVGLAAGSLYAARRLRRDGDWLSWLTWAYLATAVLALASLSVLAYAYDRGLVLSGPVMAAAVAMLPPPFGMGASLPVALHLAAASVVDTADAVASRVGRLYALNVADAVVGAVATGFWLLPALGVRLALVLAAGAVAFAAVAVALPDPLDLAFTRRPVCRRRARARRHPACESEPES